VCEPSQYGGVLVCLQAHRYTVLVLASATRKGLNPDAVCEPSQ